MKAMHRRRPADIWEALALKYLGDFEIAEYHLNQDRRHLRALVKQRLFADIWDRMLRHGEERPPFLDCPEHSTFVRIGCRAIVRDATDVKRASLTPGDDRFVIRVNPSLKEPQRRVCIAHELGHTFLYDTENVPFQPLFQKQLSADRFPKHEGLIYEIARLLLVPSSAISSGVPGSPSLATFLSSCVTFNVSPNLMAQRLCRDVYDWDSQTEYWKDSFLLFCPLSQVAFSGDPIPPKGNNLVFKGRYFRNLDVAKLWPALVPLVKRAVEHPRHSVSSNDAGPLDTLRPAKFKKMPIGLEVQSFPRHYHAYVLGTIKVGSRTQ